MSHYSDIMFLQHEGNTEEENNGYVVFELNIYDQLGKRWWWGGGGMALFRPPSLISISEPEFVNLLRIDSKPCGPSRQPYLTYRPARLYRLAESIIGIDYWAP